MTNVPGVGAQTRSHDLEDSTRGWADLQRQVPPRILSCAPLDKWWHTILEYRYDFVPSGAM